MSLTERFFDADNELAAHRSHPMVRELEEAFYRQRDAGHGVAALPRRWRGDQWFYLFAWTPEEGRELRDLVHAWIGPALSDVHLSSLELDPSDAFDRDVSSAHPGTVLRLRYLPEEQPGATPTEVAEVKRRGVLRRERLLQMLRLLDQRPASEFLGGRGTGTVLRDLELAIGSGEEQLCHELLAELERSGDLDEINLTFQRIRVLGGLRRWRTLADLPELSDVLAIRRPPGVSRLIEDALYQAYLAEADLGGDDSLLLVRFSELADRLPGIGSRSPSPVSRGQAIVQYLQAMAVARDERWSDRILLAAEHVDSYLGKRLRLLVPAFPTADDRTSAPYNAAAREAPTPADRAVLGDLEGAVAAIEDDAAEENAPSLGLAIETAVELGVPDIAERILALLERHRPGATSQESGLLEGARIAKLRVLAQDMPRSWADWFSWCESAPSTTDAIRWLDVSGDWQPLEASDLLRRLDDAGEQTLGILATASGRIIDAHFETLQEADQHEVLTSLMLAIAVSGFATKAALSQCFHLLSLAVDSGAPPARLHSMLESIAVVSENAYPPSEWIVDVLELAAWSSLGPDDPTVVEFEQHLLRSLIRTRRRVHGHAAERWRDLASDSVLAGPPFVADRPGLEATDDFTCLAGQRITIYSLDERSSNSARAHLERVALGIEVRLNHDLKATKPLKDLAANSDIMLVVTVAATHSATDAIKAARKGGRTEYVNAIGSSSILGTLSRYCDAVPSSV